MSDGTTARVSVVIPAFNARAFIADAVDSVLAQRGGELLEVIVVDDGSDDDTAAAVRRHDRVRYHRQEHLGAATARNSGIALARGTLLAFLDADDVWQREKLGLQAQALERHPNAGMIFCHLEEFIDPPDLSATRSRHATQKPRRGMHPSALLLRRADFLRVGLFDPSLQVGEFIDWHARATEAGLHDLVLPEVLVRRRVHTSNTGIRGRHRRSDYARVLKAALDRRRG